jgi:hypothetical protein
MAMYNEINKLQNYIYISQHAGPEQVSISMNFVILHQELSTERLSKCSKMTAHGDIYAH